MHIVHIITCCLCFIIAINLEIYIYIYIYIYGVAHTLCKRFWFILLCLGNVMTRTSLPHKLHCVRPGKSRQAWTSWWIISQIACDPRRSDAHVTVMSIFFFLRQLWLNRYLSICFTGSKSANRDYCRTSGLTQEGMVPDNGNGPELYFSKLPINVENMYNFWNVVFVILIVVMQWKPIAMMRVPNTRTRISNVIMMA